MVNDKVTVVLDRGTARLLVEDGEMLPSCEEALWDAVDSDESGQSHIVEEVLAAARKRVEALAPPPSTWSVMARDGCKKGRNEALAAIGGQDTGEEGGSDA